MSKGKHVITNKEESFSRKALASIIANTINIVKRCYSRITSIQKVKIPRRTTDTANVIKTCYGRITKYSRYNL